MLYPILIERHGDDGGGGDVGDDDWQGLLYPRLAYNSLCSQGGSGFELFQENQTTSNKTNKHQKGEAPIKNCTAQEPEARQD